MSRIEVYRESRKFDGFYVGQNLNCDGEVFLNVIEVGIDVVEGESCLILILNGLIKKILLIIFKIGFKVVNFVFN